MAKMMKMAAMKAKKSAMKGMKKMAMKKPSAMKGMKKMAMKVSKIAKGKLAKSSVFRGAGGKVKTSGGLAKSDLKRNKAGKVVSKKASDAAKKRPGFKSIMKWNTAFRAARKALGIKGFCPCGGATPQGKAFLAKTRSIYRK